MTTAFYIVPHKNQIEVRNVDTGLVMTYCSVPEPVESAQVISDMEFVVTTTKSIIIYRKYSRTSNMFSVWQKRPRPR